MQLGGGSWGVYGLPDNGFSNDVKKTAGQYRIKLLGYNYEQLISYADSIRQQLLRHQRIKDVDIDSHFNYTKTDYTEFQLTPNTQYMAQQGISIEQFLYALYINTHTRNIVGTLWNGNKHENIILLSQQYEQYVVWDMLNSPIECNGRVYKIGELCTFVKTQAPQRIGKENQQYRLCLQYDYIGSSVMGSRILQETIETYQHKLPLGYTIESEQQSMFWSWQQNNNNQYWLLGLIVVMIFFITSVLFNSLRLPIVILAIIPTAYIGLFITFYFSGVNFDQCGFASFILLCGLTVNASIYIVNEYQKQLQKHTPQRAYLKAFNIKIVPILLTIISTIWGFIPFIIDNDNNSFWLPLATGSISGLISSIGGLILFLPAFCIKEKKKRQIIVIHLFFKHITTYFFL